MTARIGTAAGSSTTRSPPRYRSPPSPASPAIASASSRSPAKSSPPPRRVRRVRRSRASPRPSTISSRASKRPNYARAFAYLRHHLHKRSLIVFLTDVIDPLAQAGAMAEVASLAQPSSACLRLHERCRRQRSARARAAHRERRLSRQRGARTGQRAPRREGASSNAPARSSIDVPAKKLTTALIDEYLRVKRRGLL